MPLPLDALLNIKTIITHADCSDGLASALILRDAFPEAQILFVQHGTQALRDLAALPGMLWCDFAPSKERAAAFVEAGTIVLDHHRGVADIVAMFGDRGLFADEKTQPGVSGAVLAFEYAWLPVRNTAPVSLKRTVRAFADLAGIRDTWQRLDPSWTEACAQAEALRFWGWENLVDVGWERLVEEKMAIGSVLLAKGVERDTKSIAEGYRFTIHDVRVLVFEGLWTSDISDRLADEIDLVLGFHYLIENGKMRLVVSCRSRGNAVSALDFAKSNGGGGHSQAAGFTVDAREGFSPYSWLRRAVKDFFAPL